MTNQAKRKSSESENNTGRKKKSKYDLEKYDKLAESEDLTSRINEDISRLNSIDDDIHVALNNLKELFSKSFQPLPFVIFHHQLYALIKNKTQVDREIEALKEKRLIHAFRSESNKPNENDISICFMDDFHQYVENSLLTNNADNIKKISNDYNYANFKNLITKFLNEILKEVKELSITQNDLKIKFKLTETELTILIRMGLLTIKDMVSYWFAIPFIGKFRRGLIDARKAIINIIRKKKFNEVFIEELYKRNLKNLNQIGIMYLICDLIGKETVCRVDSPTGFVLKLI